MTIDANRHDWDNGWLLPRLHTVSLTCEPTRLDDGDVDTVPMTDEGLQLLVSGALARIDRMSTPDLSVDTGPRYKGWD